MEVLLEQGARGDVVAAVGRRGDELVATADLRGTRSDLTVLTDPMHVIGSDPAVVAGRLPRGVVDVVALWHGVWAGIRVGEQTWLAVAGDEDPPPVSTLGFVREDGSIQPVERAGDDAQSEVFEIGAPNEEGLAYGAALADAIAADVAAGDLPGPLCRIVVRWFWNADPEYLTIHVLAAGDPQPPAEDAWHPLEWGLDEREFPRADRVLAVPAVREAAAALTASFELDEDGEPDDLAHVPAIFEAVRRLPDALAAHGVPMTEHFAAAAAHFEGWGALDSLRATAPGARLEALEARGELPLD